MLPGELSVVDLRGKADRHWFVLQSLVSRGQQGCWSGDHKEGLQGVAGVPWAGICKAPSIVGLQMPGIDDLHDLEARHDQLSWQLQQLDNTIGSCWVWGRPGVT